MILLSTHLFSHWLIPLNLMDSQPAQERTSTFLLCILSLTACKYGGLPLTFTLTLFYTRGLEIVVLHVMVPQP